MGVIYHLSIESEFRQRSQGGEYRPARFEQDGFIHCAGDETTALAVARSYFRAATEAVLVVRIELGKLASPCRFEAPAPLPGGGEHRTPGKTFPHIYGPLNLSAVTGVAPLVRRGDDFGWPSTFA